MHNAAGSSEVNPCLFSQDDGSLIIDNHMRLITTGIGENH